MWAALNTVIFLALMTVIVALTIRTGTDTGELRVQRERNEQTRVAEALARFADAEGRLPDSLEQMAATNGYESIRGDIGNGQGFAKSPVLSDGVWRFERAASWRSSGSGNGISYANDNACGQGAVTTAQSWCGRPDGVWFRVETKEQYAEQLTRERIRQKRVLQMFGNYWSAHQAFPDRSTSGLQLAAGEQKSLAALVGFGGDASSCTGPFAWQGLALDCGALFDTWGGRTGYKYQSPKFIALVAEAPIQSANGESVLVVTPLQILD